MKKNGKFILGALIIFLIELLLFIVLYLTVSRIVSQSIFGVFIAFSLLLFLGFFITFRRAAITTKRHKNPIAMIGEEQIQRYFPGATKVNIEDLIIIKRTIYIKYMAVAILSIIINVAFTLLAFFA